MSSVYTTISTRETPQSEPIMGRDMVRNAAGGYAFQEGDWDRLRKFLILGSEAGTYYIGAKTLTRENAEATFRCIQEDGMRAVAEIIEVSDSGRAAKNDPALFALAMCAAAPDEKVRRAALMVGLPKVARIGTHLFHFAEYVQQFRGWGKTLRRGIGAWYNQKEPHKLAHQLVKYRQRDGWTHYDLLKLAHPKPSSEDHSILYQWVVKRHAWQQGWIDDAEYSLYVPGWDAILGYEMARQATTEEEVVRSSYTYGLTREMIPNEWLNSPRVWESLLKNMPITATIRNLGKMTAVGLLRPMSEATRTVCERITNVETLKRGRVHPWAILNALFVYSRGCGLLGSLEWNPVREIVDALDEAFYLTFGNVEPIGNRVALCLDHSGSMGWSYITAAFDRRGRRVPGMATTQAAAAMALITAAVEKQYMVLAFNRNAWPISISPRQRLDDVVNSLVINGGTDYAAPINYCRDNGIEIDTFVIYGDEESWAGKEHMCQAIEKYRQQTGIDARVAIVAMCATGTTLNDPLDPGTLSVVGFDTNTPNIVADFGRR